MKLNNLISKYKKDDIKNLREVFKELAHLSVDFHFESKMYDKILRNFREGDSLSLNLEIDVVPNDLIWANKLDGRPLTKKLYRKILNLKIAEKNEE